MRALEGHASSVSSRRAIRWRRRPPSQIAGKGDATFSGADMSTKLKLLGVEVASIGDAHCRYAGREGLRVHRTSASRSTRSWSSMPTASVCSVACSSATPADYGTWLQMMLNDMDLPEFPEELLVPDARWRRRALRRSRRSAGPLALPDSAQICSCNNVSKGALCAAVDARLHDGGSAQVARPKRAAPAVAACRSSPRS